MTREKELEALLELRIDQRVELHPATDAWMQGDRCGVVERFSTHRDGGNIIVHVKMDVSGRTRKLGLFNILKRI